MICVKPLCLKIWHYYAVLFPCSKDGCNNKCIAKIHAHLKGDLLKGKFVVASYMYIQ